MMKLKQWVMNRVWSRKPILTKLPFFLFTLAILMLILYVYYNYYDIGNRHLDPLVTDNHKSLEFTSVYPLFYHNNGSFGWIRSEQAGCHEKWIIVYTNSSKPSESIRTLNDVMYGWCVLVVGDTNTPDDWAYKDVYFLSVSDQRDLARTYKVLGSLSANSGERRKIAGYLYAISKGARVIFETRDGVQLKDGLFRFRRENFKAILTDSDNEGFASPDEIYFRSQGIRKYRIHSGATDKPPTVQIGTILTKPNEIDTNLPAILLQPGQYSLVQSAGTFFDYDSFWSLMHPLDCNDDDSHSIRSFLLASLANSLLDRRIAHVPTNIILNSRETYRVHEPNQRILTALNEFNCTNDSFSGCIVSCVKFLAGEKLVNSSEVTNYIDWVAALNKIGYKWPQISSEKTIELKSNGLVYIRKSLPQISHKIESKEVLRKRCGDLGRSGEIGQISDLILITFASNIRDLDDVLSSSNLVFVYTIVCYDGDLSRTLAPLNSSSSFNTVLIEMRGSLKKCLTSAFDLGFRQQSFVIVPKRFDFWNYDFTDVRFDRIFTAQSPDNDLDLEFGSDEVFFIRRTVASGLRRMHLKKRSNINSMCEFIRSRSSRKFYEGLGESIARLNFHSNDLAGEFCDGIKTRTIWIPDYHDGPRVDISSTLVHLGMRPILANPKRGSSPYMDTLMLSEISGSLSQFIRNYVPFERNVHLETFRENFEFYQNLTEFEQVDAVICSFTVSLCEAFMAFNKTIIFNPAHR